MRAGVAVVLLSLVGCGSSSDEPAAKFWTVHDFLALKDATDEQGQPLKLGGWHARELVVEGGRPLLFVPNAQVRAHGLTLWPAVSGGAAASFVITEIWQNHPQPWVQPVWLPRDSAGRPVSGALSVFPVGEKSTFYSPFWRAEELLTETVDETTYRSARDVLSGRSIRRTGSIILCPLMPTGTGFADDGAGTLHPMTRAPVTLKPVPPAVHPGWLPRELSAGWVDGGRVDYFDFGADHAPAIEQTLQEATAYFFVSRAGERPLPLAAVLPADALRHSLVRRVDVVLPEGAAPFVPSDRSELRTLLEARELTVRPSQAGFWDYALRVAANPDCFTGPGFPAACDWLDSPTRIGALPSSARVVQPVQLAIGVVLP